MALQTCDDEPAKGLLRRYFGDPYLSPGCADGAYFDAWHPNTNPNRFDPEDLLSLTFLSVPVPPAAIRLLLCDRACEFERLLTYLGPDRDLADEKDPLADDWIGWRVMTELRSIPDVGGTIGTKLLARKRPRLRPIWDQVVAEVTQAPRLWEPLRQLLRADDCQLHDRLLKLRHDAGLPETISAIRVFDVIAWREGMDGRGAQAGPG